MSLVDRVPDICHRLSYGCYDGRNRQIHMLVSSECMKLHLSTGQSLNASLCGSLLAHEIAHSVVDANADGRRMSLLAQEYLAYVTFFASLPKHERELVLAQLPGEGFESVSQMSITYYVLDPLRFGAEAYRHFLELADTRAFVDELIAGKVLKAPIRH